MRGLGVVRTAQVIEQPCVWLLHTLNGSPSVKPLGNIKIRIRRRAWRKVGVKRKAWSGLFTGDECQCFLSKYNKRGTRINMYYRRQNYWIQFNLRQHNCLLLDLQVGNTVLACKIDSICMQMFLWHNYWAGTRLLFSLSLLAQEFFAFVLFFVGQNS